MKAASFTKTGTKAAEVTLDSKVFGVEINADLIKQAYVGYQANQRQANAKVLTRAEVSGGGRKPWRQKGTGRARFGSIRVPIWRHGGVAHGPTGLQNYSQTMPRKMARAALKSALSAQAKITTVIDQFDITDGKTSSANALLTKLGMNGQVLIVMATPNLMSLRSLQNLPGVGVTTAAMLNVHDVMNADAIIIEKSALETITKRVGA